MYNEKFLSIHILKNEGEPDFIKEAKKAAKQRTRRINKKWDEELQGVQEWSEKLKKVAMQGALEVISSHRQAELDSCDLLVEGSMYLSYYPSSARITDSEKKGKRYSEKYPGPVIICGRFEEMFLLELFEEGKLLSKVLLIDGEIAETISPDLLLDEVRAEDLLDEQVEEDEESYWEKEDFAKMDIFLQETYHFYADVSENRELKHLPLLEEMDGLKIYDGTDI